MATLLARAAPGKGIAAGSGIAGNDLRPRWWWSRSACLRPWTVAQAISHGAVFYSIACFALLCQPAWLAPAASHTAALFCVFWALVCATLALYAFVCSADVGYHEGGLCGLAADFEPRVCEDCSVSVTHTRVKHCQVCGTCVDGFDHHCRYLNVCIGSRTYRAWFAFVLGLLSLMLFCTYSGGRALLEPGTFVRLRPVSLAVFYVLTGVQAITSLTLTLFLFSLAAQHVYFMCKGITTLEFMKDQAAGFPGLPRSGWRAPVARGECYECKAVMEVVQPPDPDEVWFCSVCQVDLSKAAVEFYACPSCESVSICPVCRAAARDPHQPIVTYRAGALRRITYALAYKDVLGASCGSLASVSSQRRRRPSMRGLVAAVAAVEGHSGEPARREPLFCRPAARGEPFCSFARKARADEEADDDSGGDGSASCEE